ncbi:hypothetical protein GCM10027190_36450 [Spirosoma areae]
MAKIEYDYWMNIRLESRRDIPFRNLTAIRGKLTFFADNETLFGYIQTRIVPGHTPGHTIMTIRSAFDTDPSEAVVARKQIFADLAVTRQQVFGYHLLWPGLGHIRAVQDYCQWVPAAFFTPLT